MASMLGMYASIPSLPVDPFNSLAICHICELCPLSPPIPPMYTTFLNYMLTVVASSISQSTAGMLHARLSSLPQSLSYNYRISLQQTFIGLRPRMTSQWSKYQPQLTFLLFVGLSANKNQCFWCTPVHAYVSQRLFSFLWSHACRRVPRLRRWY